ncbi:hypothetical protein V1525DRAFT_409061 [Lipomyces kononenkoae]|uniref:Uncharacterized protein n=1 Tax=Lipomyces kononenkoae TaxID=34357 RepID=A0ACC3SX83_LIPKO
MRREDVRLAPHQRLRISSSPTEVIKYGHSNYEMQPDGVVYFKTRTGEEYKVVVEIGFSQTYDSLLQKARKWIFDTKCKIVLLLAFYEKERCSAPLKPISLTSRQMDDQVAFIEVVRKDPNSTDTNPVLTKKYVLTEEGRDRSSDVPRTVGDMRLAELIPRESLGSDTAADVVIDFFDSDDFMSTVRDAVISIAVNRLKKQSRLLSRVLFCS